MSRKPRIAITIRSFDESGPAFERLWENSDIIYINKSGERLNESTLSDVLKNAEGVIAGTESLTECVLKSAPYLRVISRVGVGLDSVDMEEANRQKITVFNTPDAPTRSVAEHTIALLLSIVKKIPQYNSRIRKGDYSTESGSLIFGKKIGIVGLGRIGFQVAELASALGCSVQYYDPLLTKVVPVTWMRADTLIELLACADVVTLHASPQPGKKYILDESNISNCKKGAILLNTARGTLIEEQALIQSLDCGRIASVGLDVFPQEPYTGKLLEYDQVIMTPHVASNTREARKEMEMEAVNNLLMGMRGGTP
jgi:D-3-phosphoglycerate dehydrogenase